MSDLTSQNGQPTLPETMQTKTSDPGTTAAAELSEEMMRSGQPLLPSAAAAVQCSREAPTVSGRYIGEASSTVPASAGTAASVAAASLSSAAGPASATAPTAYSATTPTAYIQDPEFIKAINVIRKYSDSTVMSSVGGSLGDAANGCGSMPPQATATLQAGDSSQQQQPYGSPSMRPMHYTQLGSSPAAMPSQYQQHQHQLQQQQQRMGMPYYEDAAELDARARGGNPQSEYMSPYPATYYDARRYYHNKDNGMSAAAAAAASSYMRRQSSTMVTDGGYHHQSDQLAMYRERPMARPGVDNFCYVARRRSTYPLAGMCDVMEEVQDFKYRLPDPFMYPTQPAMYANGLEGGHAAMSGGYRHVPHGGYDGGAMLPALQWSMYPGGGGGSGGSHEQAPGVAAAAAAAAAPASSPMPAGMSYRALLPPLANGSGGVGSYHNATGIMNNGGSSVLGQHLLSASGESASHTNASATSGMATLPAAAAAVSAAGGGAAISTGSAPVDDDDGKCDTTVGSAAAGAVAAEHTSQSQASAAATAAAGPTTSTPRKRAPPPAAPEAQPASKRSVSAAAAAAPESSPAESSLSAAGGVNGGCKSGSKRLGRQAAGSEAAEEQAAEEHPPLETAALRPRKSCMGGAAIDGGQQLRTAAAAAASGTTPDAKEPRAAAAGSRCDVGEACVLLSDVRRKASPTWDVGAIVWARLSGERWWPAMTIEGRMALQKPAEGINCWVFWYGDHKVSEIPSEKIMWFADNFHQRFSSSGGKIYKKAVAEALLECIRRSGCSEAEQAPIAEDNEHLRSCARQLFEQKGVSNIDKTPGTVSPVVAEFLRVIASRIPAGGSPSSDGGSSSSSGGKKASSAAAAGDDAEQAEQTPPPRRSAAAAAAALGKTGGSRAATPAGTPKPTTPAATPKPATPAATPKSLTKASAVKPSPSNDKSATASKASPAPVKTAENGAKKPTMQDTPRMKNIAPKSPASSTSSNGGSNGGSACSSNSGSGGGEDVKTEKNVSRQQYRAMHGKQLDDFFNEVRAGKRSLDDVCIACNAHRKPVAVQHPLIHGGLCGSCKGKVMDALFSYGTDGCNVYCVLCGEGGDLLVCGLNGCGKTYCRGCIETLGSPALLQRCLKDNPWACFTCSEEAIMTKDRKSLIVRRPNWQSCISTLFERPNSVLHRGPSASDFTKKRLRVLSLFDGISTGKVVVDKLGFDLEVYYASEIDADSLLVTQMNHGDSVVHLGDVCLLTEEKLAELGRIDLLIGGSPCNDLSLVNPARKGIYDGSGVLFFEFYRILQTLISRQPGNHVFWLFENVVAMRVETKDTICRFLECEPVNFNAGYVSAQNRARYFWGNIPGLYTPLNPDVLEQNITLQSVLTPGFNRKANVQKLRTVTTRTASLKQGHKEEVFPVTMNGQEGRLWPTELELVFGMPRHYTDVGTLGPTKRQKLLGRAWCVPVVEHLLTPLKQFFLLKEGAEKLKAEAQAAKQ